MGEDSYFWPMNRRRTAPELVENIDIIDISSEGAGVGKKDGKVIFVEGAVPGDVVNAMVFKKKKDWASGKLHEIVKASEHRIEAACQHFGLCGGCKWQHLSYEAQLEFKQKFVIDAFERIAKVPYQFRREIIGSESIFEYRNKLEFSFSASRWLEKSEIDSEEIFNRSALGFHIPGRFDKVFQVQQCLLMPDFNNQVRNFVHEQAQILGIPYFDLRHQTGNLRSLMMRQSNQNEWLILLSAFEKDNAVNELLASISKQFPEITSLLFVENKKRNETIFDLPIEVIHGTDHIVEKMGNLSFKISAKSFFQTNSRQAQLLYDEVVKHAALTGNEIVYDLYTGTGTIANFLASKAKKVIGLEYVADAVNDAMANSHSNRIDNTVFIAGDMKDVLTLDLFDIHGKPDVIITDPPRAGMHEAVIERLLEAEAPLIVYVSCNAATQARDAALLHAKYDVTLLQPVDMFPHTTHVENIAVFKLRS